MVISSNGTSNTISINTSGISVNVNFLTLNSDTNKNYDYNIDNNYITFKNIEYITKKSLNIQSIQLSLKSENNTFNSEKIKLSNSQIKNNFIISYPTFNFTSSLSGSFTDVQLETTFISNNQPKSYTSNIDPFSKLDIESIKSGFDFENATIKNINNNISFNPLISYNSSNANIFNYIDIINKIEYTYNNIIIECNKNLENDFNNITKDSDNYTINSTISIVYDKYLKQSITFNNEIINGLTKSQ